MCPSGVEPQRNTDGNIMWCRLDAECRNDYECVPIVGLIHFGNSVKYCCPTKSSYCTKKPHFPPDLSACTKPPTTIYYFDVKRKKCRPYVVASCNRAETMVDEMENRFGTLRDCKIRCGTTGNQETFETYKKEFSVWNWRIRSLLRRKCRPTLRGRSSNLRTNEKYLLHLVWE